MSRWCITCQREPYIGCDKSCPVFGKGFGQYVEVWKGAEPIEGTCAVIVHEGTCVVG